MDKYNYQHIRKITQFNKDWPMIRFLFHTHSLSHNIPHSHSVQISFFFLIPFNQTLPSSFFFFFSFFSSFISNHNYRPCTHRPIVSSLLPYLETPQYCSFPPHCHESSLTIIFAIGLAFQSTALLSTPFTPMTIHSCQTHYGLGSYL